VQAAEFLGCQEVQADIIDHLQKLLLEIMEWTEKIFSSQAASLDSLLSHAAHNSYTCYTHNLQVCVCNDLHCASRMRLSKQLHMHRRS
jgi:hypothetical protein